MGVDEPWNDGVSLEIDDSRRRPRECTYFAVRADEYDTSATNRDRTGERAREIDGVDTAVDENEVRRLLLCAEHRWCEQEQRCVG